MKHCKTVAALAVALALTGAVAAPSAHAATRADVLFNGTGALAPGLSMTPAFQFINFSGSGNGTFFDTNGTATAGSCNPVFNGASTIAETLAYGEGHGEGGCAGTAVTGAPIRLSCHVVYIRTGAVLVIADRAFPDWDGPGPYAGHDDGSSCTGTVAGALRGVCTFEMRPPSIEDFILVCHAQIED